MLFINNWLLTLYT